MLASKAYTHDIPTFDFFFKFSLLTAASVKVFCDLGKPFFKKNVSQIGLQETVVLVAFICPLCCACTVFSVGLFLH